MTPEQRTALRRIDRQFDGVRAMPEPIPMRERYRNGIEDVREGGYLRCAGQLYRVVSISQYREKNESWSELEVFSLTTGDSTYLEWEKDDQVEISLSGPELSLSDLGVTSDQVEAMSDEEEGRISFDGRSYHYDDDYGATYFRESGAEGEPVYCYDFESKDEKYSLTVEEWGSKNEGYEYSAFVSEYIEPEAVEVLVLAANGAEA